MNQNIDEARIVGIEFSGSTHLGGWNWQVNASYQEAEESSGPRKGDLLARRPRAKLDLDASRRFDRWLLGANVYAQSKSRDLREDFGGGFNAGFATLNVRGEFRIEKNWVIGLKLNNILDKEYETARFFPQDGFNVMATLRYTPAD